MSSVRVLLVDDDAAVRESVGAILKYLGCAVVVCSSVRQAIDRVGDGRPYHLTFIDRMLPDGDGVELVLRLQMLRLGGRKVLFTGQSFDRALLPAQIESVLPKPLRLDDLARLLHSFELIAPAQLQALGLGHLISRSGPTAAGRVIRLAAS